MPKRGMRKTARERLEKLRHIFSHPQHPEGRTSERLASVREALDAWHPAGTTEQGQKAQLEERLQAARRGFESGRQKSKVSAESKRLLEDVRKQRPMKLEGSDQTFSPQLLGTHGKLSVEDREAEEKALADHISRGEQIYRALTDGGERPEATRDNVSALSFYLRAQSEKATGRPWLRGAMTIPDRGGKIRSWLDSTHGHVYTRDTSHLSKEDQEARGGQGRGMDFEREGPIEQRLPYGMRTLLFQQYKREGQQRLYLKMETEGARFNPTHSAELGGREEPSASDIRPMQAADVPEAISHLKNLLIAEKDTSGLARYGEKFGDLPKDMQAAYRDIVQTALKNPQLSHAVEDGVSYEVGPSFKGIPIPRAAAKLAGYSKGVAKIEDHVSQIEKNLDNLQRYLGDRGLDPKVKEQIQSGIDAWRQGAQSAWGASHSTQSGVRVGNEVVLQPDDLGSWR